MGRIGKVAYQNRTGRLMGSLGERRDGFRNLVTLPKVDFMDHGYVPVDTAKIDRWDVARRIRRGHDAWVNIGRANGLEAWQAIGAALVVGRAYALKMSNCADINGHLYRRHLSKWLNQHGFNAMSPSVRYWALAVHDAGEPVVKWWATLSDSKKRRLNQAQSIVGAYRKANGVAPRQRMTCVERAKMAWHKFQHCLSVLTPAERVTVMNQIRLLP
jgi:hypothetical protein